MNSLKWNYLIRCVWPQNLRKFFTHYQARRLNLRKELPIYIIHFYESPHRSEYSRVFLTEEDINDNQLSKGFYMAEESLLIEQETDAEIILSESFQL